MNTLDLSFVPAEFRPRVLALAERARAQAVQDALRGTHAKHVPDADVEAQARAAAEVVLTRFRGVRESALAAGHEAFMATLDRQDAARDACNAMWERALAAAEAETAAPAATSQTTGWIRFNVGGREYAAPMSFYDTNHWTSPDGRTFVADGWRESMPPQPVNVREVEVAARAEAETPSPPTSHPFLFGHRLSGPEPEIVKLTICDGHGLALALRAVVAYLGAHVAAPPVDLVLRAIVALAATLPAGPLALHDDTTAQPVALFKALAALVRAAAPVERPELVLAAGHDGAAAVALVAALPGAETWTQPYPLADGAAAPERLEAAEARLGGLRVKASVIRPATAEEGAAS